MEPQIALQTEVAKLLMEGKVPEALSIEMQCHHCSKKFKVGHGAREENRSMVVDCPHCKGEVFRLSAK